MKKMNIISSSILCVLILFVSSYGCSERLDNKYLDYSEAIESQSWKGGWLPRLLPKDAVNISESHYSDRSSIIVSFEFRENFETVLDAKCKKTDGYHIEFADMTADWWPESLVGEARVSSHEYYYYKCSGDSGYFAIPFEEKKAYFWKTS